jgi:hypothetical protein
MNAMLLKIAIVRSRRMSFVTKVSSTKFDAEYPIKSEVVTMARPLARARNTPRARSQSGRGAPGSRETVRKNFENVPKSKPVAIPIR